MGKDHTLFALVDGKVVFKKKKDDRSYVSVIPNEA
jgi:large subunit ribosomal protein L27